MEKTVSKTKGGKCTEPVNANAMRVTRYYKNQKFSDDGVFEDDLFPPTENTLLARQHGNSKNPHSSERSVDPSQIGPDNIEWKRAKEIFPNGFSIFESSISMEDVLQGGIGDCYFLAALTAICEHPEMIVQVFRTLTVPENGCYEIVAKIDGFWQIILLDDWFPVEKGTRRPIFAQPNGSEIWVMLLEKAWAKINGGYLNIMGGMPCNMLKTFTSFATEYILHKDWDKQELWAKLLHSHKNDYIGSCATEEIDDGTTDKLGVVGGHAYTLIGAASQYCRQTRAAG